MSIERGGRRLLHRSWGACLLVLGMGCAVGAQSPAAQRAEAASGMIVAGHPAAVEAGLAVLRQGGTAMDAAVAVSLALGVAEPYGSGIGGKLLFLHYEAASGEVTVVDALDAAPHSLDVDSFRDLSSDERAGGWVSVAVPGCLAGLEAGHARWGRLSWADCVAPAVAVADEGFSILPKTHLFLGAAAFRLSEDATTTWTAFFEEDGQPLPIGAETRHPELADTLRLVAVEGAAAFYEGHLGEAYVSAARTAGVDLSMNDLADYAVRITEPGQVAVAGGTLWVAPPPAVGGIITGSYFLRVQLDEAEIEPIDDAGAVVDYAKRLHPLFAPIYARAGDEPGAAEAVWAWWEAGMPAMPDAVANSADESAVSAFAASFTTHFVVGDEAGNIVSATQSLSSHFGAGVEITGTGIVMNNTMKNFALLDPASVNRPAPGKRPRTTIAPVLWTGETGEVLALGLPGGARIPTGTIQVLQAHFAGLPLGEAIEQARVHVERPRDPLNARRKIVFETTPHETVSAVVQEAGWDIVPPASPEWFGGVCALRWTGEAWIGWADQRRTNAAAGWTALR